MKYSFFNFFILVVGVSLIFTSVATAQGARTCDAANQCKNCVDDDRDGKADYDGYLGGTNYTEPDPSCYTTSARDGFDRNGVANGVREQKDDVVSEIIPCTDKCTFSDVFKLLNNILTFFITTLLIPIFIMIVMYAGFKYIAAQGNSGKIANIKSMLMHIVGGIILILCAWLIVRTIMTTLLNDEYKQSGVEFLGQ